MRINDVQQAAYVARALMPEADRSPWWLRQGRWYSPNIGDPQDDTAPKARQPRRWPKAVVLVVAVPFAVTALAAGLVVYLSWWYVTGARPRVLWNGASVDYCQNCHDEQRAEEFYAAEARSKKKPRKTGRAKTGETGSWSVDGETILGTIIDPEEAPF